MIMNPVLAGAGISQEELQAYLDGAHIEFVATQGDNTLHLRPKTAGYDCTIHWGDGSETVAPANGGNVVHNYAEAKTYHIFITGRSFAGFYVDNQTGKEKYVAAHSMGKWEVDTMVFLGSCFYGCTGLTELPADLFRYNTEATSFNSCFHGCTGLTTLPTDLFRHNTTVTEFGWCFKDCSGLTALPTELFRYNAAATAFTFCFFGCTGLTTLPSNLFRYNTKAVNFRYCFYGCTSLTTLPSDLFRYNTAAMYFSACFENCTRLTELPVDLFRYNTKAMEFNSCFFGCTSLTALPTDLFRYNTEATDFFACFRDCYYLTTLPTELFRYNTKAEKFSYCFQSCVRLTIRSDIFGAEYSTRFSEITADFSKCFDRQSFAGTQGAAPALWSFTFGSVTSTGCFGGSGNSATSLSNYSSIPAAWK